jgi:hypothetical protein
MSSNSWKDLLHPAGAAALMRPLSAPAVVYTEELSGRLALEHWSMGRAEALGAQAVPQDVCWDGVDLLVAWAKLSRLALGEEAREVCAALEAACRADLGLLEACVAALELPGPWEAAFAAWDEGLEDAGLPWEARVDQTRACFEKLDELELVACALSRLGSAVGEALWEALEAPAAWLRERMELLLPLGPYLAASCAAMREDVTEQWPELGMTQLKYALGLDEALEARAWEARRLPRLAPEGLEALPARLRAAARAAWDQVVGAVDALAGDFALPAPTLAGMSASPRQQTQGTRLEWEGHAWEAWLVLPDGAAPPEAPVQLLVDGDRAGWLACLGGLCAPLEEDPEVGLCATWPLGALREAPEPLSLLLLLHEETAQAEAGRPRPVRA